MSPACPGGTQLKEGYFVSSQEKLALSWELVGGGKIWLVLSPPSSLPKSCGI